MQSINYIALLVIVILFAFVWFQESQRYDFCLYECSEQFNKDVALLDEGICLNARTRLKYQRMVDCEGAEKRTRVMPRDCAWQKWRTESQIMHIYVLLTGSYWSLTLFVMPLCMFGMWLWTKRAQNDKWLNLAKEKEKRKREKQKQLKQLGFGRGIMDRLDY